MFKQPELARTLERIAKDPDDFYHGAMARELAAAIHKGGGLVTAADLAAYEVKEREPIRGTYRGYDIISAPPPSSGGVALVEILNILEGFDLAKLGNRSAETIHLEVEAFRRAFYDRADFMGDPDFAKVPVAQLIDKKYAAAWRDSIDPNHASGSKELKRPRSSTNWNASPSRRPTADSRTGKHDSLFRRRCRGQRRRGDHHAQRLLRLARHRRRPRFPAQRRDGRLRRQAGRAQRLRT